jgi:hypothetical protein
MRVCLARLAVYVVRSGALGDEGVFRIAGRKDHADSLRAEIESGKVSVDVRLFEAASCDHRARWAVRDSLQLRASYRGARSIRTSSLLC